MTTQDDDLYLTLPNPEGFIETLDAVRELRKDADEELEKDPYDPCNFTARRVAAMRQHADNLEGESEKLAARLLARHIREDRDYRAVLDGDH